MFVVENKANGKGEEEIRISATTEEMGYFSGVRKRIPHEK